MLQPHASVGGFNGIVGKDPVLWEVVNRCMHVLKASSEKKVAWRVRHIDAFGHHSNSVSVNQLQKPGGDSKETSNQWHYIPVEIEYELSHLHCFFFMVRKHLN